MQKKMFKIMCAIPKRDGTGEFWTRLGSGFENRDTSINLYFDVLPMRADVTIQLRELDEADLRPRDGGRRVQPALAIPSPAHGGTPSALDLPL